MNFACKVQILQISHHRQYLFPGSLISNTQIINEIPSYHTYTAIY
jgi:hypothetical protein